jgi:hypothetical protein
MNRDVRVLGDDVGGDGDGGGRRHAQIARAPTCAEGRARANAGSPVRMRAAGCTGGTAAEEAPQRSCAQSSSNCSPGIAKQSDSIARPAVCSKASKREVSIMTICVRRPRVCMPTLHRRHVKMCVCFARRR